MHKKEAALQVLLEQKLLPLFYHESETTSIDAMQALYEAGIKTVEYTNRGEAALANFKALRKKLDSNMPGFLLGIGTIKNGEQAKAYIDAGADYIVCPSVNETVAQMTHDAGLLWIPGCMTPTEIAIAENAGAALVKLFPGNLLGPSYVNAVKDLFPNLKFMPTGGVEVEAGNLAVWFKSGVVAVGMGSKLITKEILQNKDWSALTSEAKKALQLIQDASS
ncbi:MAG: ketohydroxyglutarate aldolase [Flaviaesturariibacter sp.]|nr:ketohydroxyglutarate aldolase [Flaviaesturariibacter sp.]